MPKIERLESDIKRALSTIIRREVKNPMINFVTITAVDLTKDLSYLTIHYTLLEDDEKKRNETAQALEKSSAFIRTALAKRVNMRKMPQLRFKYDTSLETGNRIERGLKDVLDDNEK